MPELPLGGDARIAAVTPQGDAWKQNPSRLACGACHDGINFDTGIGVTLRDANATPPKTVSTGFNGQAHPSNAIDGTCSNAGCHGVTGGVNLIDMAHIPVTPPNPTNSLLLGGTNSNTNAAWIASGASANRLPTGAIKVTYEVSSVSRNASKQPVMVFRLLQNGARKDLNDFATTGNNPATGQKEIWDNFMGAPSVYFVWAVPQDGSPSRTTSMPRRPGLLRTLWAGGSGAGGTLTGPDANGFYTATLTTVQVPDSAVMLTGGLGYSYNVTNAEPLTQTNLAAYPTAVPTNPAYTAAANNPRTGGLVVIAPNVNKVATNYTARRVIVEDKRCNACHQELGTFTEDAFHAGQRNDGTTCSWCHTPNRTSSAWSADSVAFVHGIHGASKRTVPYTWHALSTTESFADIGYPGVLSNCEQCHVPGSYDFGASGTRPTRPASPATASRSGLPRTVGVARYAGAVGVTYTTYSLVRWRMRCRYQLAANRRWCVLVGAVCRRHGRHELRPDLHVQRERYGCQQHLQTGRHAGCARGARYVACRPDHAGDPRRRLPRARAAMTRLWHSTTCEPTAVRSTSPAVSWGPRASSA